MSATDSQDPILTSYSKAANRVPVSLSEEPPNMPLNDVGKIDEVEPPLLRCCSKEYPKKPTPARTIATMTTTTATVMTPIVLVVDALSAVFFIAQMERLGCH